MKKVWKSNDMAVFGFLCVEELMIMKACCHFHKR